MKTCINLGSGNSYRESNTVEKWINIDKNRKCRADYYLDLEKDKIPCKTSTADYILMRHFFEHIRNIDHLMNECWRVLKHGGTLHIISPYWTNQWSVGDPTHVRSVTENTFMFFDKVVMEKCIKEKKVMTVVCPKCDFVQQEVKMHLPSEWLDKHEKNPDEVKFAMKHYLNVVEEIEFYLRARKK